MDHFFDAAARVLASEMPRRQALLRLGGLLAGGILASLGVNSARAQAVCTPPCTGKKGTCCPGTTTPFCTTTGKICCGTKACKPTAVCCPGNGIPFCATTGKICCGTKACKFCCPGNGIPFCRTAKKTCCGSTACKAGLVCCSGTLTCCKVCNQIGQCTGSPS